MGILISISPLSLSAQEEPKGKPKVRRGFGGKGTIKWPNGVVYQGEITKRQAHGTGTMTYADGGTYEGQWQKGKRHGTGNMTWSNGATYKGQWANGWREGQGVYVGSDGVRWDGHWDDGRFEGEGTRTWPDGQQELGWFQSNRLVRGARTFANGARGEGDWHLAKPLLGTLKSGIWTRADGSRDEGFFASGSGRLIQGRKYNAQGQMTAEGYWDAETSRRVGYYMGYLDKNLTEKFEGHFNENGWRNGWFRYSFDSGYLGVGRYEEGKRVGPWVSMKPVDGENGESSYIEVRIYKGESSEIYRWSYPQPHFGGVPRGTHTSWAVLWSLADADAVPSSGAYSYRGAPGSVKNNTLNAYSLEPNILYLGTQGDADGRAHGTGFAIFLRDAKEVKFRSRSSQILERRSFSSRTIPPLFVLIEKTTWRAGHLISAEIGDKEANALYYIGEVDDRGRKHGKGLQSRVSNPVGMPGLIFDNENLEAVTFEHGSPIGHSSYQVAWNEHMNRFRAALAEESRQAEETRQQKLAAEQAEEARRRQADLARREGQRQRSRDKAAAAADRWNEAQAQRDREMRGFQRDVAQHNRNLAGAFEDTRRAQQAKREAEARRLAQQAEQQRLAREAEARRAEAERQRLAAEAAAREEAERKRLAAEEARREREAAEAARRQKEQIAQRAAAQRERAVASGTPEPTGLTPPPGRLPEVPQSGYSAWTRYAEARDGSGSPLVRLEYRIRITRGLGDEPYVNVAWRATNLSNRTLYDVSILDKHYTTEKGTQQAGSGESFGTVAAGETDANQPDVMQAERLETFQLVQPGIRLRLDRDAPITHWQTLGSVTYF